MFNAIIAFSLRQRLMVLLLAFVVSVAGVYYAQKLPVDVFPDLNKPTVTIMTESAGMAPEEVETLVSFPLESGLNGMPGVTRVRSVSGVGLSVIYVEFDWQSDIWRNRQLVAERLSALADQLPEKVSPQMAPVASIMGEILLIGLSTESGDLMQLRDNAEYVLRPRLLSLPGVAQVIPIGGEKREFRVAPSPLRMHALEVELDDIRAALSHFGQNTTGGFLDSAGAEFLIRHQGRSRNIDDLKQLVVAHKDGHSVLLSQVAEVTLAARARRGDAGMNAGPAVILSVQKQPHADTGALTKAITEQLMSFNHERETGLGEATILFRQASFIERSISNVKEALFDGALWVAAVLFVFLLSWRPTLISLTAIPLSMLITVLLFTAFGLSINTMTLGGIAIAVGELVDDAVVDVENILRRLRENSGQPVLSVIANAAIEVRSGVLYATLIVVLVFVPLFALPGIEGRLFMPLGLAYVTAIMASLLVSMTVTPIMCSYLLPAYARRQHADPPVVKLLKSAYEKILHWAFERTRVLFALALLMFVLSAIVFSQLSRSFLPAFNEGTLTIDMQLKPGIALAESSRIGALAEKLLLEVPEVVQVGRRTGRAELDEHAEGVHYSELDVDLEMKARSKAEVIADIRQRLALLPVAANIGQPISHRLDHLLSGVRAEMVIKVFGDDLDTLRGIAESIKQNVGNIPGLVDLRVERQVRVPQLMVQIDYALAAEKGVEVSALLARLEQLVGGEQISEIIDGNRRIGLSLRMDDQYRDVNGLRGLLVPARDGHVPLSAIADIREHQGPNQIGRDQGRRRIVISANRADDADLSDIVEQLRAHLQTLKLPAGYYTSLEGQFQAQEEASIRLAVLGSLSVLLIFAVLYQRYRSVRLTLLIMASVPFALIGGVLALALSDQALSVASMVGFITLIGIATRNGILKISHYLNLLKTEKMAFDERLIVRGALERMTPVLMTALTAAFALIPLVLAHAEPGKEILHPVALVIFGGLLSATVLDTLLTPLLFYRYGKVAALRVIAQNQTDAF